MNAMVTTKYLRLFFKISHRKNKTKPNPLEQLVSYLARIPLPPSSPHVYCHLYSNNRELLILSVHVSMQPD